MCCRCAREVQDGGGTASRRLRLELQDGRVRGRLKRRFMDVVTEDMMLVYVRDEDAEDRVMGIVRELFMDKE